MESTRTRTRIQTKRKTKGKGVKRQRGDSRGKLVPRFQIPPAPDPSAEHSRLQPLPTQTCPRSNTRAMIQPALLGSPAAPAARGSIEGEGATCRARGQVGASPPATLRASTAPRQRGGRDTRGAATCRVQERGREKGGLGCSPPARLFAAVADVSLLSNSITKRPLSSSLIAGNFPIRREKKTRTASGLLKARHRHGTAPAPSARVCRTVPWTSSSSAPPLLPTLLEDQRPHACPGPLRALRRPWGDPPKAAHTLSKDTPASSAAPQTLRQGKSLYEEQKTLQFSFSKGGRRTNARQQVTTAGTQLLCHLRVTSQSRPLALGTHCHGPSCKEAPTSTCAFSLQNFKASQRSFMRLKLPEEM